MIEIPYIFWNIYIKMLIRTKCVLENLIQTLYIKKMLTGYLCLMKVINHSVS